jgi:hypothetical protein
MGGWRLTILDIDIDIDIDVVASDDGDAHAAAADTGLAGGFAVGFAGAEAGGGP